MGPKIILSILGGMGLVLYGMYLMREGLQKIAGHRLRDILSSITRNKIVSLIIGALVTVLFQSSTATIVTLIGLTSASIITLKQSLGIILGADIGTTVTAQLIALKVTEVALPIVGIGAAIIFFTKRDKYRRIGQALIGFGLLFLGLKIIGDTMQPLQSSPYFRDILLQVSGNPLLAIAVAAIFTSLVFSSAATIGIIMLLAIQGMIPLIPAIYLLYGANIGTSFTAVLTSLNSSREAQRVAAAHIIFKLAGVLIFLPLTVPFANLMQAMTTVPGFQVANAHTFFNITIAISFLPFTSYFAAFLGKIIPDKKEPGTEPKYLDNSLIAVPSLAIGLALKEVVYISDNTVRMLKDSKLVLDNFDQELIEDILSLEDKVDEHTLETRQYLIKVLRNPLSRQEFIKCLRLINIVNELEIIGDVIEKNILYLAESKQINSSEFSDEGKEELDLLHEKLLTLANIVNNVIFTNDPTMTCTALALSEEIVEMEFRSRISHIQRLSRGISDSENTSTIHLDLINAYVRIAQHLTHIIELNNDPEILDIKNIDDFCNGIDIFCATQVNK